MPVSGPILWQLSQLWIGPTYQGGMFYYINYPGPDATNPSYQVVKSLPPSMSGLPPGWTGWNPVNINPGWSGSLRWRVIDYGSTLQIDGNLLYPAGLPAGSQAGVVVLPSYLTSLLTLPKNFTVMTNSGLSSDSAFVEIQANPAGSVTIKPLSQTMTAASFNIMLALNSPYNETIIGNYGTLTAAQAAAQNDVNPPIPMGLHAQVGT